MAPVDGDRRQAFRARRPHVVLVLDVEHRRACDPRDDGEWDRPEGDRREDEVLQNVPERVPVPLDDRVEDVEVRRVLHVDEHRDPADAGKPGQADGEDVLEDDREEEDRNRYPEQRRHEAHVVEDPAVPLRGDEAERHPGENGEEHRGDRQLHGGRELLLDLGRDAPARGDAHAEVALDGRLQVRPVLLVDGLVEPVVLAVGRDERRRRPLTEE